MFLSDWDLRLIKKHLVRYQRLANGQSKPTSNREISFINFIKNNEKPRTQHEIAYSRYLQVNKKQNFNFNKIEHDTKNNKIFEDNIDYLDEKISLNENINENDEKIAQKISSWYKKNIKEIPNIKLAESLAWLSQITSESALSKSLERLSAESFNTLSNAYTKALDGVFAEGLKSGIDYISPTTHRIDIPGHTLLDAIQKIRDALPDDTKWEEFKGLISSLASDMSSVTGLPISVLGKESRETITTILEKAGISESKFVDLWSQNTVEVVGSVIPAIALLLSWNDKDTQNFTKIVGMINVTSLYAGNPISMVISIIGLARSYHRVKKKKESSKSWILALSKGGAISTASIILMSLLGPIIWTSLIIILIAVMIFNKNNIKINWSYLSQFIKETINKETKKADI
ncbi:DUF413 domain-containing protein [Alphaproteobacteria bacterium]|nr:DUF413 domain-containing protein [Alphaproteobacteria bacterium]